MLIRNAKDTAGKPIEVWLRGDKVAHYFTGHCTGKQAYERLKRKLGDRLGEMPAGSDFTV